jgi:phage terminase large subunit-like protein
MRKIGLFNIGKLGLVKSAGKAKTDINKVIEKWVKEHMVFWYDMSKPVDVYVPGVTYANPFVNGGEKLTYDKTINKCIITHTPTNNNNIAFWQIIVKPLQYVESYKIRVTGLPTGFTIKGRLGYDDIQITSDGEYDIPEYRNSSTTNTSYPGFYLAGDNVDDVDCNIVVEEIPTKQSVPTNEILKANPYLQDHSGNNRPLKLNNFLFAAMSGVGGYDIASTNILPDRANVTVTDNRIIHITKKLSTTDNMVNIVPANSNPTHKFKVTGLSDGRQVSLVNRNGGFYTFDNGEHEVTLTYPEGTTSLYNAIGVTGDIGDMDVTIEFLPKYPNALVTDGVDDYGVVENFKSLQNYMMFFQCAIIRPTALKGMFSTTSIAASNRGWMLLQGRSANSVKFGNYVYTDFKFTPSVEDKISYVLSANNELMTCYVGEEKATLAGTYGQTGTNMSLFLSDSNNKTRFGSMAFYKSILFDSVPTKETDGFTEQELIDYYIPKAIVTITVVDVSGSPIQDATVTVEGIQYKTLSDGTVKVRGMVNSTMSLSVKKDGYMPFSDNSWKFADSRITLEVLRNTVITENGYSILLENDGLILTE